MSKGNRHIKARVSEELYAAVQAQVDSINAHGRGEVVLVADFVRQAIQEKLCKMARSRTRKARPAPASGRSADTAAGGEGEGPA